MPVSQALSSLRTQTLSTLRDLIGTPNGVALIDFPSHQNAGDSLIYQGTLEYLERLGVPISYEADRFDFDEAELRRRVGRTGTILLHGGGNFGDVWPEMQLFRESVIAGFPDARIVQLPQSMHFSSPDALARAAAVYGRHRDLVVLMRDTGGVRRAVAGLPGVPVVFCPDLALGAGSMRPIAGARQADRDVVYVLRGDVEGGAGGRLRSAADSGAVVDWGLGGFAAGAWKASRIPAYVSRMPKGPTHMLQPAVRAGYRAMLQLNLRDAAAKVTRGNVVVTDRLHAAVLSSLLDREVVVMDNNYGKIRPIFDDYLHTLSNISFADSPEQAATRLRDLLPQPA